MPGQALWALVPWAEGSPAECTGLRQTVASKLVLQLIVGSGLTLGTLGPLRGGCEGTPRLGHTQLCKRTLPSRFCLLSIKLL